LLRGVWIDLVLGFILAGLMDVLIPAPALSRWLGNERPGRGILVGWGAGLLIPRPVSGIPRRRESVSEGRARDR